MIQPPRKGKVARDAGDSQVIFGPGRRRRISKRSRGGFGRRSVFILATSIAVVGVVAASVYTLWRLRAEAIDRHSNAAAIYARAFEDHLTQSLNVIDLTLSVIDLNLSNVRHSARSTIALTAALRHAPYLRSLALLDAGDAIFASSDFRDIGIRIARREFLPAPAAPAAVLRVGPPWAGRDFHDALPTNPEQPAAPEQQTLIPVLRDIALGRDTWSTLVAAVNTDFFLNYYGSVLAANVGTVELLRYDGLLLLSTDPARKPGSRNTSEVLASRLAATEFGQFEQVQDDGREVLTAYRASRVYPFVVVVRLDKEGGLTAWRDEVARTLFVLATMLAAAFALAGWYFVRMSRAARQHDADVTQLRLRGAALEAAANAIMITDQKGRIEWANPAFCALSGYTLEEALGQNPRNLVKSGRQLAEGYQDLWRTILAGNVWRGEMVNRRKDNTHYLEDQTITPVLDSDGSIRHFIAVKQDITERKRSENDLALSNKRLEALIEAIPDAIFFKDPESRWLITNEAAKRLFQLHDIPWQGKTEMELAELHPEYRAAHETCLTDDEIAWETGKLTLFSETVVDADGQAHEFEVRKMPVFDEQGRRQALVILGRDITERRRGEEKMKELSRHLVAVQESARRRLSGELHDRTSPNLAAIGVNLDIIAQAMAAEQSPLLAERLADVRALIEDTAASIREISSELRPPVLDHGGLLAALDSYVKQFQRRTGMVVRIDCAQPALRLAADLESALFRLVQEALTNCAKHSRARSIAVALHLDGPLVTLTVSDDGIGFDPESLGKITHAGGLGILTMREMAEFLGGHFSIESAPRKGTRVKLEIESSEGQG